MGCQREESWVPPGFGAKEDSGGFQQYWKNKELPLLKERLQTQARGEDQELSLEGHNRHRVQQAGRS